MKCSIKSTYVVDREKKGISAAAFEYFMMFFVFCFVSRSYHEYILQSLGRNEMLKLFLTSYILNLAQSTET